MSRARRLRHPLHPALVHFPIALWTVGLGWDALGYWRGDGPWWTLGLWSQVAAVGFGAVALLTGFLDFRQIAKDGAAINVAVSHMLAMSTAYILFLGSAFLRWPSGEAAPPLMASLLGLCGFAALVVGGWLGGSLVYRHGVGVGPTPDSQA